LQASLCISEAIGLGIVVHDFGWLHVGFSCIRKL